MGHDRFADIPQDARRAYVARCMNLRPDPTDWPIDILDGLIDLRLNKGEQEFYRRLGQMLSPDGH